MKNTYPLYAEFGFFFILTMNLQTIWSTLKRKNNVVMDFWFVIYFRKLARSNKIALQF